MYVSGAQPASKRRMVRENEDSPNFATSLKDSLTMMSEKVRTGGSRGWKRLWQGSGTGFPHWITVGAGHPEWQWSPAPELSSSAAPSLQQWCTAPSWAADLISGTLSSKRPFTLSLFSNSQRPSGCSPASGLHRPDPAGGWFSSLGLPGRRLGAHFGNGEGGRVRWDSERDRTASGGLVLKGWAIC